MPARHPMSAPHVVEIRVRYSDTDQMGSYYNSRALEWFEVGRSELLRALGRPYREMEAEGIRLPLSEAHVEFLGKAQYDDRLAITTCLSMPSRARLRFDVEIVNQDQPRAVCRGYTVHAVTDANGRPIRPPAWLVQLIESPQQEADGR